MTKDVPLTLKDVEALHWMLVEIGDRPNRRVRSPIEALAILRASGHTNERIAASCAALKSRVTRQRCLPAALSPLDREILRLCIERSTWIKCYHDNEAPGSDRTNTALHTLRVLARKFDRIGIEVNHIPA